ncbi:AAA family ATPase [uncultured Erythrobacter sp.]|uniref:AAA family ATPase n=1 Tax=uncultured Erythrobacter sp. TaxID=263913 RepID=UPI002617F351|nr:AAA family ATPase [uncultured Erythrobacter sp.]
MNARTVPNWPNHDEAWQEWKSAMNSARMHHGWILAGKKGLGKLAFAQAAARELVAEDGIPQPPGEHPDILTVTYGPKDKKAQSAFEAGKAYELARSIRIAQIREMQRRLTVRPTLGARRVVIINPADDMERATSNALLKSLEEPPEGTFFILVTHRPARLLPTIRSRCRILRFPALTDDQLAKMLTDAGERSDFDAAICAAEGSFGAALQFAEQDLGPIAAQIDRLLSQGDRDMTGRGELSRLIGPRADRERLSAVFELAQSIVANRARSSEGPRQRAALVEAHSELVTLAGQAPSYNFDTGLLCLEIGTLLYRAHVASEHAHG